jgi:DNA-binding transcriptional regulator YdaS (Cro superfamily)
MDGALIALGRALEFFGDHKAMARALGIRTRQLWGARDRGRVSGEIAEKIHRLSGGNIRREELRPDLFPRERHYNRVKVRRTREQQQRGG